MRGVGITIAWIMLSGCGTTPADGNPGAIQDGGGDLDVASEAPLDGGYGEDGANPDAPAESSPETSTLCTPGDRRCQGAQVESCSDRGTWTPVEDCPFVCLAGNCVGACVPGAGDCVGPVPRTCSDAGQWVEGEPCAFVCLDGVCAGECAPGARRCLDLVPETCSERGEWEELPPCPVACSDGRCSADGPVDPVSPTSWQPTLLVTPDGLAVVFEETDGSSYWNVKVARFDLGWEVSTTLPGHRVIRDGADVDSAGVIHVALADDGGTAWHARSDQGWALSAIDGLAPGYMTCAVDQDGSVHITSAIHLHERYYANNVGGAFQVLTVSTSNTAPAAILAAPGLPVTITYNHWSSRQIRVMDGDNWGDQTLLHQYGIDNGPGLALKHRDGKLRVALAYHQNTYAASNVGYQTNATGSWIEVTVAEQVPTTNSIDLAIDAAGHNHVLTCDVAGTLSYYTDSTGAWSSHVVPGIECRPSPIDSQFWNGRLHVAYQGTDLRLHVASIDPAAFGGGR